VQYELLRCLRRSRNSTYIRIPLICFRKLLLPHSAVHRSKTLRVSSLSGIRPIKKESSKILPASSQIFAASFLALLIIVHIHS
jgi:hypothetical protein